MKTKHLSIIALVGIAIMGMVVFTVIDGLETGGGFKADNFQNRYQSEFYGPYDGIEKDSGLITIKNQTYYMVTPEISPSDNQAKIDMGDASFLFPKGIQVYDTPGGSVVETIVTFKDGNSYRLAAGAILPKNTNIITALSKHENPQAGITMFGDKIKLLISTQKPHSEIRIIGLENAYKVGDAVKFSILIHGFGMIPCSDFEMNIKNNGSLVYDIPAYNHSCQIPVGPENYEFYYPSRTDSFGMTVNQTGDYAIHVSFGGNSLEKKFTVESKMADMDVHPMPSFHPANCHWGYSENCYSLTETINDQKTLYYVAPIHDAMQIPTVFDNVTITYTGNGTPKDDQISCDYKFPKIVNFFAGHHPSYFTYEGAFKINQTRHFTANFANGESKSLSVCWLAPNTHTEIRTITDAVGSSAPGFVGYEIEWFDDKKTAGIMIHDYNKQDTDYFNSYVAQYHTCPIQGVC